MIKQYILRCIEQEENKLNYQDADGHIWWGKFRDFIENIPEVNFGNTIHKELQEKAEELANGVYDHLGSRLRQDVIISPDINELMAIASDLKIKIKSAKLYYDNMNSNSEFMKHIKTNEQDDSK